MTKILDGKKLSLEMQGTLQQNISQIEGRKPGLGFILVGENPASQTYVQMKARACERVGIYSVTKTFPKTVSEKELLQEIERQNRDPKIDGILVQMPLPAHIDPKKVTLAIDPSKDVDGFHPLNVGKMLLGDDDGFFPCTPFGIKILLEKNGIDVSSKHVVILGRSNIVGKPLAALLMQKKRGANATVTIAHSETAHLKEIAKSADILIGAMGKPLFITKDMVKKGAVVVDVGITKVPNGDSYKLVGDVDFEEVAPITSAITPVPGGVGPMTIAILLENTYMSFLKSENRL
jgi:methylenetetrahydrofolate dehydrogenase (NADP+) / methenyltetrahydrofolate cyclohydrolase